MLRWQRKCSWNIQDGSETRNATFETVVLLAWLGYEASSTSRFVSVEMVSLRLAALTPFSSREVYRGVAEVSIYVASRFRGKKQVLTDDQIIISSELNGIWTLVSSVSWEWSYIKTAYKYGFRISEKEKNAQLDGNGGYYTAWKEKFHDFDEINFEIQYSVKLYAPVTLCSSVTLCKFLFFCYTGARRRQESQASIQSIFILMMKEIAALYWKWQRRVLLYLRENKPDILSRSWIWSRSCEEGETLKRADQGS